MKYKYNSRDMMKKIEINNEMNPRKEIRSKLYWLILGLISIALLAYMIFPFLDVIIRLVAN
uniref:Uncharacterized protein n=1 Tax=Candidatus Methanophagaceae archaeon ANME-1 ERB6 TaxID=2759912 RepID=A0A7G9YZM8_9EURY|nr:hypothetical protein HCHKDHBN_00033 [Methanosarcinales archaeon ANME-1 ERB6]